MEHTRCTLTPTGVFSSSNQSPASSELEQRAACGSSILLTKPYGLPFSQTIQLCVDIYEMMRRPWDLVTDESDSIPSLVVFLQ